jgi:chemotaxis protein CheD
MIHQRRSSDRTGERRSADRDTQVRAVTLFSGDYFVTDQPRHMIMTILGSCVAACMHDPVTRVGGMNHFLLPESPDLNLRHGSDAARYGAYAMEQLINGIIKLGGVKSRLEVKVFGGGNVIDSSSMIGSRNIAFVRDFLESENLPILGEDLGDTYPRRLRYYPDTGKVMLLKLKRKEDQEVVKKETTFIHTLTARPVEGSIELF